MSEPTPPRDTPGAIGSVLLIGAGVAALIFSSEFSDLGAVFPRAIGGLLVAMGVLYLVFYALGRTDEGRELFVAFTMRGRRLRVVSARDMSRRERRVYRQ